MNQSLPAATVRPLSFMTQLVRCPLFPDTEVHRCGGVPRSVVRPATLHFPKAPFGRQEPQLYRLAALAHFKTCQQMAGQSEGGEKMPHASFVSRGRRCPDDWTVSALGQHWNIWAAATPLTHASSSSSLPPTSTLTGHRMGSSPKMSNSRAR